MMYKEYMTEEMVIFRNVVNMFKERDVTPKGTTFAGTGKIISKSLTPNPIKADKLRTQKYW